MSVRSYFQWHNLLLIVLIAAIAADIVFGLDKLLNVISTVVMVGSALAVVGVFAAAAAALCWITIRDLVGEIRTDTRTGIAWRWKLIALAGGLGILVDGAVGAWNAYQRHMQFSTAVENIPFSGVPVLLLLASYPFKWAEQYFERPKAKPLDP